MKQRAAVPLLAVGLLTVTTDLCVNGGQGFGCQRWPAPFSGPAATRPSWRHHQCGVGWRGAHGALVQVLGNARAYAGALAGAILAPSVLIHCDPDNHDRSLADYTWAESRVPEVVSKKWIDSGWNATATSSPMVWR